MLEPRTRRNALIALLLLVPAASFGIAARLYLPGPIGQFVFIATRVWILVLPLIWYFGIEHRKLHRSQPHRRELLAGTALGLAMFGIVLGVYWSIGQHWINPVSVQAKAQQVGITSPTLYLAGAFYFTFVNSLIEEYIWRWFVYQNCEVLFSKSKAVYLAAICFTLHHIIALAAYTGNSFVSVIGSLGVFLAGAIWSWCYLTYRSLWACYISHLLADLAIALIGWHLLFG